MILSGKATFLSCIGCGVVALSGGVAWFMSMHQPFEAQPVQVAAVPAPQTPAAAPADPLPQTGAGAPAAIRPQFDVVRVEPTGEAVIAGRAGPNSKVALLADGRVLAETQTDAGGNFVMIPETLSAGDHVLALQDRLAGGTLDSAQSVAVSVPERGKGRVVVALAEPGKPSRILTDPTRPAAPVAAAAPPVVTIKTAEAEGEGFFASGMAASRRPVRIYLNDAFLAEVTARPDGEWSIKVAKGLMGGHFVVRADVLDATGGVSARAEVPFDMPFTVLAEGKPPAQRAPLTTGSAAPDAVIDEIQTAKVQSGDTLWRISRKMLGLGIRYTQIYAANAAQIRDPRLIYPGQVFVLPAAEEKKSTTMGPLKAPDPGEKSRVLFDGAF